MKITKSGFYKLSELIPLPLELKEGVRGWNIIVEDNISAIFFDDCSISPLTRGRLRGGLHFELGERSQVEIFGVLNNIYDYNLNIISDKELSNLKVRYLLLSGNEEKTIAKINSSLEASQTKSDVKIISLVLNGGYIDIDGIIDIKKGIEKVKGHLNEENIFLGNSGKIKGIPKLLVASNDVEASHACKIEKISDDELFYLRSRGVGKDDAIAMMIEAKISDLFKCLSMVDKDFYEELVENILDKIK